MAQRLLVGFDGSAGTCAALRHAAGLAAREHGTLTIVTVLGRSFVASYAWCAPVPPPPDREEGADSCLRKAVRDLPEHVSVTWLVRHGNAAEVLAEEAEQRGCDAIVVARRRLAWRLRRLTAVPVIAVRRPRPLSAAAPAPPPPPAHRPGARRRGRGTRSRPARTPARS